MFKFDFKKSDIQLTQEEYEKAKEQSEKGGGSKFIDEGVDIAVTISDAEYNMREDDNGNKTCMCESDNTWAELKVTYEDSEGRTIRDYLNIPTKVAKFKTRDGKESTYPFVKFGGFMAGIGETVNISDIVSFSKLMKKYFADPKKLVGKSVSIDVGYKGPYVKYITKDQYKLCKKNGTDLIADVFPSREEALLAADKIKVKPEKGVKVLKIHSKVVTDTASPAVATEESAKTVADDDDWG